MVSGAYAQAIEEHLDGNFTWLSSTVKVMAVATGFTLLKDGNDHLDEVQASRYLGTTDQVAGGKTQTRDSVNNRVEQSFGQVTFTTVALDAAKDVIGYVAYYDSGSAATSPLICFDDATDVTPNGGDVLYTPNPEGVVQYIYGA